MLFEQKKGIQYEQDSLGKAKAVALGKVRDILGEEIPSHRTVKASKVPQVLRTGLIAEEFAKRAKLPYEHSTWFDSWVNKFVFNYPDFKISKAEDDFHCADRPDSVQSYIFDIVSRYEANETRNMATFLIDPSMPNKHPDEWLKEFGYPQKLVEDAKKANFGFEERCYKTRVAPRYLYGLVLGDEVAVRVYYWQEVDKTLDRMVNEGLLTFDESNELSKKQYGSRRGAKEVNDFTQMYWKTRQTPDLVDKFLQRGTNWRDRYYDFFALEPEDQTILGDLTLRRVAWVLSRIDWYWQKRPECAVPIYGSSGDLYWPIRMSHDEIRRMRELDKTA